MIHKLLHEAKMYAYDEERSKGEYKMKTKEINIPISEDDIEDFKNIVYNNSAFSWSFTTSDGEQDIKVNFMSDYEDDEMTDSEIQLEHWDKERI